MSRAPAPILSVRDLHVRLWTKFGVVRAVNGVSLDLAPGEVLGIVGESGSGKSIAMLAVRGLLDAARVGAVAGSVTVGDRSWNDLTEIEAWSSRSEDLAMIFQDAQTALNPVLTIEAQIVETLKARHGLGRKEARARAIKLLEAVRIPDPQRCLSSYPHQLSGGMCQRVMIAMAVGCEPKVLIADEPTTALDVTVQAQILNLISEIQRESGMSLVIISHDLGVIASIADRVHVMYAGRIVEKGTVQDVFAAPRHPYTQALLACTTRVDDEAAAPRAIPGALPDMREAISGCPFRDRCPIVLPICATEDPELDAVEGHAAACWRMPGADP